MIPHFPTQFKFGYPLFFFLVASSFLLNLPSRACYAGGGPENVALIVNLESQNSLTITNHFIQLRGIPENNIIYLKGIPAKETISIDECRELILKPIYTQLVGRKLISQIDYVVYSSDFPTAIKLPKDANKLVRPVDYQKYFFTTASLNAVTYFMQQVMAEDYAFLQINANYYTRQSFDTALFNYYTGPAKTKYQELIDFYQKEEYESALEVATVLVKSKYPRPVMRYWQARCLARLEKKDEAIQTLILAVKHGWGYGASTASDEAFANLANDEVFVRLIKSIDNPTGIQPTTGFRSGYTWRPNGMRSTDPVEGRKFLLSMMLGCTRGKGNTVDEVISALKKSVSADGTHPNGTFYFVSNNEIRAKTRAPFFQEAVDCLEKVGRKAEIIKDAMPKKKSDVLGAMTGISKFDFSKSESKIMAGAICDNLTSFGGKMAGKRGTGQTTVSEFIANGAAGASGTVVEPYTVPHKFPQPMIHFHYSQGSSLAEAFYQSVYCPYQLLIVGDPLCQPFATFPKFDVNGIVDGQIVNGKLTVSMKQSKDSPVAIQGYQFFFNGRKVKTLKPSEKIHFDSTKVGPGFHEFRIVAIAKNRVETVTGKAFGVFVSNGGSLPAIAVKKLNYKASESIQIDIPKSKYENWVLLNNSRVVASADSDGKISLAANALGLGPVRLKLAAKENDRMVQAKPFFVTVTE